MFIFDVLSHFDDQRVDDPEAVLRRAAAAGVSDVILAGVDPLNIPDRRWPAPPHQQDLPRIHRAYGLHPQAIDMFAVTAQLDAIAARLDDNDMVAIGEIGLDDRPGMPPMGAQEMVLQTQLHLASVRQLPVILHLVGKPKRLWQILKETIKGHQRPLRGMIHAFPGPKDMVRDFAKLGFYFSFGGAITNPHYKRARQAAAKVPEDRLLVESDCPDHPAASHGPQSEPAMLPAVLEELALLRDKISEAPKAKHDSDGTRQRRLAEITHANAKRLFFPTE